MFKIQDFGFRVKECERCKVQDVRFTVYDLRFTIESLKVRV